jgi:hypothetical protein
MRIKLNILIDTIYENIEDIDILHYNNVVYINCHDHKLLNVDFINYFPNLKVLIASNNLLNEIPSHNNLEILDINTNKVKKLGNYPKILKLYAFNNLLTQYNVPLTLFELDLSNNKLIKLNYNRKQIFLLFNINYNKLDENETDTIIDNHYNKLSIIYE